MQKIYKGLGFWLVLIFLFFTLSFFVQGRIENSTKMIYSDLIRAINEGNISEIVIDDHSVKARVSAAKITDKTTSNSVPTVNDQSFHVEIPSIDVFYQDAGEAMEAQVEQGTLKVQAAMPKVSILSIVSIVLPVLLLLFIWFSMIQRGAGGKANTFTKSRAKMELDSKHKVTFQEVAGATEEKAELQELVEFLKNPQKFIALGARIPKGVLLVGPPGTGKTLLAKAIAGEAGVPFFSISGSDFVELYVGVGASRVRDLFEQAKKSRPCIIFIDEIDAVGRRRGAGMGGGHDEREQTLNQLLVEMDGFGANEGVIMIAATNRPDILDPALLRPGRFDRQVVVSLPDVRGREEILKVHSKNKPLDPEVNLEKLAKATAGYSGADLENLMNEGAIFAARREHIQITNQDLEDANVKVMMGTEKKSRVITDKEKKLTAYHEAGHAVLAKAVDETTIVNQVSIIPRGTAGGYTMYLPDEDKMYMSKSEILNRVIVLLGGRVAEQLIMDDISTGASSDIQRATDSIRQMVAKYGMSEKIGPVSYDSGEEVFIGRDFGHSKAYSEKTAADIDDEVKAIMQEQYKKTVEMLRARMPQLEAVAKALLEQETIDQATFEQCLKSAQSV